MSGNDLLSCTNSLVTIMVVINHRNIPRGPRCLHLLTLFFVPPHQFSIGFISEKALQMWYYWEIPHHLTRIILPDHVPFCITDRTSIQFLIFFASIENTIIRTCVNFLYLQSKRANNLLCFVCCRGQFISLWKHVLYDSK